MSRGLDHIVHAVHDLDAAATFYRRLGFIVGARNRHPWGTHNHIVQFPGTFLELLTVAEPEKIGGDGLSTLFARFNQSVLQRHDGLSFLILESKDAVADAAAFAAARIAASDALTFGREASRPDGAPVTVGFSLAFARDARAPSIGFATCEQLFPEYFWNPDFQAHPNTASGVAGVVLVADNPTDHHIFLSAFTGERELLATSTGITVKTVRGDLQVMAPAAFRSHFGVAAPDLSDGPQIAAVRIAVRDPAMAAATLSEAGIETAEIMRRIIVGPGPAMGATIVFEPAA